ncbi:MAG TPA: PKD domain-containing protein [Chitinophagaceae bacterium]|nr:PKD domain-containing protein [Chitinophagaceae bacterium]
MALERSEYRVNEKGFRLKLDRKVLMTFLSIMVLCVLLFAFKLVTNVECHLITIKTTTNSNLKHLKDQYFSGEIVQMTAVSKGAKQFEWDFGDGTPFAKTQSTTHAYIKPGNYVVQVKINDHCIEFKEILVINSAQTTNAMMDALKSDMPYIMGPEVVTAGEPATFQDASQGSSVWEWSILNTPSIPMQTGVNATFTFPVAGTKIIYLKTNGDESRVVQKTITIVPKQSNDMPQNAGAALPPPSAMPMPMPSRPIEREEEEPMVEEKKKEEKPVTLQLPDMEFKNMIEGLTNGKVTPEAINAYLCNGTATKVHKNGDWDTWGNFAREISGKKRVDIKAVKVYRDENGCVTTLEIDYKKRLF